MKPPAEAATGAPPAGDDEQLAHLLCLHALEGMGPARLQALLADRSPRAAWEAVARGERLAAWDAARVPAEQVRTWAEAIRRRDPTGELARYRRAGIEVIRRGDPRYPARLAADVEPPTVLFATGDVAVADLPLVAVVGTRRATPYGCRVARLLGRQLSEVGIQVVSGLASGIDAAAHRGALEADGARPLGVVGTGLDVVYPRSNRQLWDEVARRGALVGEAPLGARADRWRFPARNRIVAALASAVVVVESHARGGSLSTADEAVRRDRPVLAVPGSVLSPASAGANGLIAAGAHPARDVDDILVAIDLAGARRPVERPDPPAPGPAEARLLDALGWEPAPLDEVARRSGLSFAEFAAALDHLEEAGHVVRARGWLHRAG